LSASPPMRGLERRIVMRGSMSSPLCRCGHPLVSHEHLRYGTECVWCAPGTCERFRVPSVLERLRHRLGGGTSGTGRTGPTLVLVR